MGRRSEDFQVYAGDLRRIGVSGSDSPCYSGPASVWASHPIGLCQSLPKSPTLVRHRMQICKTPFRVGAYRLFKGTI